MGQLQLLLEANQALGRLDGFTSVPDLSLFLYAYVRKEALLSSQIEVRYWQSLQRRRKQECHFPRFQTRWNIWNGSEY
jgi:hypothetical protein